MALRTDIIQTSVQNLCTRKYMGIGRLRGNDFEKENFEICKNI